jgi:hypothetical protein
MASQKPQSTSHRMLRIIFTVVQQSAISNQQSAIGHRPSAIASRAGRRASMLPSFFHWAAVAGLTTARLATVGHAILSSRVEWLSIPTRRPDPRRVVARRGAARGDRFSSLRSATTGDGDEEATV